MGWKTWNDRLALLVLSLIAALWLAQALGRLQLPGEVTGALIATWTLIVQYYFRKAPPEVTPNGNSSRSGTGHPDGGPV